MIAPRLPGGVGQETSRSIRSVCPTIIRSPASIGGYNNEQILSTSHFRIYRSIGGDSADLTTQRFAGRMTAYLILRAIGSLFPATNPANAAGWVTALLAADLGDWLTENVTGGAMAR